MTPDRRPTFTSRSDRDAKKVHGPVVRASRWILGPIGAAATLVSGCAGSGSDIPISNRAPDVLEDLTCVDTGEDEITYSGTYSSSFEGIVMITAFDEDSFQIGASDEYVDGGGAGERFSGHIWEPEGNPDSCTFQMYEGG